MPSLVVLSLILLSGILLFLIVFFNLLFLFLKRDRYSNERKVLDHFKEEKVFDPKKEKGIFRKPTLFLVLADFYFLLLFFSLYLLGFGSVYFMKVNNCYAIPAFALSLLLSTLTTALFSLLLSERKRAIVLMKEGKIAKNLLPLFPGKVRFLLTKGNDLVIRRRPFLTSVSIGSSLLLYLSEKELFSLAQYQVSLDGNPLFHRYHQLSYRIRRLSELTQGKSFFNFLNILFFRVLIKLKDFLSVDFLLSEKHWEKILKDEILEKNEREKTYLAALAKKESLDFLAGLLYPDRLTVKHSTYPENYDFLFFQWQYETIQKGKNRFLAYLANDSLFESFHPEKDPAILDRMERNLDYDKECQEEANRLSRKHWRRFVKNFDKKRFETYLALKDITALPYPEKAFSQLLSALLLEREGKEEEALLAFEAILKADPENSIALYHKGRILLRQDDIEGVKDIEKASLVDSSYLEDGLLAIDAFYRRNGYRKEKEETDKGNIQKIQNRVDETFRRELTSNSKVRKIDLPKTAIDRLVALANLFPDLHEIKMVMQMEKDGRKKYHIGLLLDKGISEKKEYEIALAFYLYLEDFRLEGKTIDFFLTLLESREKYDVYSSYLNGKIATTIYEKGGRENG